MNYRRLAIAMAGVALAASTALAQDYPEIKLRNNNLTAATAGPALATVWFSDEVAKRSGGKITIENFWSGAAGAPTEQLKLVGAGALDAGNFPGSYFPAQMPLIGAISALPIVMPNAARAQEIATALWEKVPAYQEEAKANNIWSIFFKPLNDYHLLCTTPIRTLKDLEGKKIRSQGEYIPLAVKAVGAVPVTVLPGEFYEALQRGTVDCMLLPWDLLNANKLHEVAKFGSMISFGSVISDGFFVNLDKWNSLPDNVKQLLTETGVDAQAYGLEAIAKLQEDAVANMKAKGVEFIEFPEQKEFEAKLPDFFEIWRQRMVEAGKGDAAAEAIKLWKSML
jgi:TRAP-type C4-dicarboxylate transport system substrate-binding protein